MKAPDVIYAPNTTSPEHLINDDAFTAYVRLSKVKELISINTSGYAEIAKRNDMQAITNVNELQARIKALEALLEQLEGLE